MGLMPTADVDSSLTAAEVDMSPFVTDGGSSMTAAVLITHSPRHCNKPHLTSHSSA